MTKVRKLVVKDSFIHDHLVKPGAIVEFDSSELNGRETNLADPEGVAAALTPAPVEVVEKVEGNDDDVLVEGTLATILPTLGDKSIEELEALKAAEVDREEPRSTLTKAIDKELAARQIA